MYELICWWNEQGKATEQKEKKRKSYCYNGNVVMNYLC